MPEILSPLYWDDDNVEHLWRSHQVTPDEVEELLFGVPGEEPTYRASRDSDHFVIYGETGSGRLLTWTKKRSGHTGAANEEKTEAKLAATMAKKRDDRCCRNYSGHRQARLKEPR